MRWESALIAAIQGVHVDDTRGHFRITQPEQLERLDGQVACFFTLLKQYGLGLNIEKSKVLCRLHGRAAKAAYKRQVAVQKGQKCWVIAGQYAVLMVDELPYLWRILSVRRSSATLALKHRDSEADGRSKPLARTTRSRRIIDVRTRLRVWQTCVTQTHQRISLSSAMPNLGRSPLEIAKLQHMEGSSQRRNLQFRSTGGPLRSTMSSRRNYNKPASLSYHRGSQLPSTRARNAVSTSASQKA